MAENSEMEGIELERERRDIEDVEHAQAQSERLDDELQRIAYEAEPTRLSKVRKDAEGNILTEEISPYHARLSKELALGNITRADIGMIMQYHQVINLFIDLQLPDVADIYHAELMVFIDSGRGVDGFLTKASRTITTNLNKNKIGEPKAGLFNR